MMTLCEQVHVYEYIPSMRQSDLCHYHERYYDAACTLGAYHPLLYEKSLIQRINTGPESDLRKKGRVTLPGFSAVNCDIWSHSPSLSWNTLAFPRWPRGTINWRRGRLEQGFRSDPIKKMSRAAPGRDQRWGFWTHLASLRWFRECQEKPQRRSYGKYILCFSWAILTLELDW